MSPKRTLIAAAALLSVIAGAAYAQNPATPLRDQTREQGPGMMGNGNMMGKGGNTQGMMGMMNMMAQASQMMDTCNNMMKSAGQVPNGQWQKSGQPPEGKG